jgi:hypothetical protein
MRASSRALLMAGWLRPTLFAARVAFLPRNERIQDEEKVEIK